MKQLWRRYRFKTYSIDDYRPLIYNPKFPYWCSGIGEDVAIIVAWFSEKEDLSKYWDDAHDIEFTVHDKIEFSERFPKPNDFIE